MIHFQPTAAQGDFICQSFYYSFVIFNKEKTSNPSSNRLLTKSAKWEDLMIHFLRQNVIFLRDDFLVETAVLTSRRQVIDRV